MESQNYKTILNLISKKWDEMEYIISVFNIILLYVVRTRLPSSRIGEQLCNSVREGALISLCPSLFRKICFE